MKQAYRATSGKLFANFPLCQEKTGFPLSSVLRKQTNALVLSASTLGVALEIVLYNIALGREKRVPKAMLMELPHCLVVSILHQITQRIVKSSEF